MLRPARSGRTLGAAGSPEVARDATLLAFAHP
jgi:hypothetical protein